MQATHHRQDLYYNKQRNANKEDIFILKQIIFQPSISSTVRIRYIEAGVACSKPLQNILDDTKGEFRFYEEQKEVQIIIKGLQCEVSSL